MATRMTALPGEPILSTEQRRALTLLARIPRGITKNTFPAEEIRELMSGNIGRRLLRYQRT